MNSSYGRLGIRAAKNEKCFIHEPSEMLKLLYDPAVTLVSLDAMKGGTVHLLKIFQIHKTVYLSLETRFCSTLFDNNNEAWKGCGFELKSCSLNFLVRDGYESCWNWEKYLSKLSNVVIEQPSLYYRASANVISTAIRFLQKRIRKLAVSSRLEFVLSV